MDWHTILPFRSDAASGQLGWVGLQAARCRAEPAFEHNVPALAHHRLVFVARPPDELELRFDGVKRHNPSPVGSITLVPAGNPVWARSSGHKDELHIFLDAGSVARVTPRCRGRSQVQSAGRFLALAAGVVRPKSRGRIRLTGPSPLDPVQIEANFLSDPADVRTAIAAVGLCREIGNSTALRAFAKREVMPGNLIMPRVTTGDTMAPCVVIGERAGEMLRRDHGL